MEHIYKDYCGEFMAEDRISYSSFVKVINRLTCYDQKAIMAIDYAIGLLLYDNLTLLNTIVSTITNKLDRVLCKKSLVAIKIFMKHEYSTTTHIGRDICTLHHLKYALKKVLHFYNF